MPSAVEIRKLTSPYTRKSTRIAGKILAVDLGIYGALLTAALLTDLIWLKALLGIVQGFVIGLLFIVGHDCCHKSFTPSHRLNRLVGKGVFALSLHNFSLWELGHNKTHHAFTNLKGKDYVYEPLSPTEYRSKNGLKRLVYRLYRSIAGHFFYYTLEIWFKKMIVPHKGIPGIKDTRPYWQDSFPLVLFTLAFSALIYFVSSTFWLDMALVFAFPILVFYFMMGFIIYQHHTSPDTRWYEREEEWEYWEVQIGETVHVEYPKPMNVILHNIMEHTAHHSNMLIPLYQLSHAQRDLDAHFEGRIKVIKWTWTYYWDSIRQCKLYDYEQHRWLRFGEKEAYNKDVILDDPLT